MESFEVCHSFVGFLYLYCLFHQSVVVFCFVQHRRNAVQFFVLVNFSNVYVCFVFRRRSAVRVFFVSVNFSNVLRCKCFHVSVIFSCILVFVFVCLLQFWFYVFWFQIQLARLRGWKFKQFWLGKAWMSPDSRKHTFLENVYWETLKQQKKMIARLHSSKRNVEREWEEKRFRVFAGPCCNLICSRLK